MKVQCIALSLVAPAAATNGKSTIAAGSGDAMVNLEFMLRYLPVTVGEDNGVGNFERQTYQARVQALLNNSYTEPNCQLYSAVGTTTSASSSESMTSNGVGSACTYSSGEAYGEDSKLWMVYAYNSAQCCNACVATSGCAAATFHSSDDDQSGGQGPQSWEGFGIHLPDVTTSETTGGLPVADLQEKYASRLGDFTSFDAFMDYSVTFFVYDLEHYVSKFASDEIPHLLGKWTNGSGEEWYSMIFQIPQSTYIIELVSANKPSAEAFEELEQRMSEEHCEKFKQYEDHQAKVLSVSSINRAASDISEVHDVYTSLFKANVTHSKVDGDIEKRCYSFLNSASSGLTMPPGPESMIDVDVCFTSRKSAAAKDAIFSVADHEAMLWAAHASTLDSDPTSMDDKYTDSHYALPMPSEGLTALASYFSASTPYPIKNSTRLAYACMQNYIIDPTGFSIQPEGRASWPGCSSAIVV